MFQTKAELMQIKKILISLKEIQSGLINDKLKSDLSTITVSLETVINFYFSHDILFAQDSDKKEIQHNLFLISQKINKILKKIDKELQLTISLIETEMHGIEIYSEYEREKIKNCEVLENLKASLLKINNTISQSESMAMENT